MLIDLDKIVDELEDISDTRDEEKYTTILNLIEERLGNTIRDEGLSEYENFDRTLQIAVVSYEDYPTYLEVFDECAYDNGFNPNTYIDYAIKKITEDRTNYKAFINGLLKSEIIQECNYVDGIYSIVCGSVDVEFRKASEYYKGNEVISEYIGRSFRKGGCHENALFLLNQLKKGEAVTVKMKDIVGEYFYHSYYRCDGIVTDLNNNVVMDEEDYNLIYSPLILSVVKIDEYDDRLKEVNANTKHSLIGLLAIAIYQEYIDKKKL